MNNDRRYFWLKKVLRHGIAQLKEWKNKNFNLSLSSEIGSFATDMLLFYTHTKKTHTHDYMVILNLPQIFDYVIYISVLQTVCSSSQDPYY